MNAADDVILRVEGLDKHFGGLHAIRSVSVSVERRKIRSGSSAA